MTAVRRCAFLTMDETEDWSIDADLAFAPLQARGWHCSWIPWRAPSIAWDSWDAVYLAATWDYPEEPQVFMDMLSAVTASGALLVNDVDVVRWNLRKTYLRDLEAGGVSIVPTLWFSRVDAVELHEAFDHFHAETLVFKPVVGANAVNAFLIEHSELEGKVRELRQAFDGQAFMAQPFVRSVQTEGEHSLMYMGGKFSHAIRKVPKEGDFRVQEEHGASIVAAKANERMLEVCGAALGQVTPAPFHARCDLVVGEGGAYQIMELELIEPSLYLRMDADAPARFAEAFDCYFRGKRGSENTL